MKNPPISLSLSLFQQLHSDDLIDSCSLTEIHFNYFFTVYATKCHSRYSI